MLSPIRPLRHDTVLSRRIASTPHATMSRCPSWFARGMIASAVMLSGCGPSQEELMMKAAARRRPLSAEEKLEKAQAAQEAVDQGAVASATIPPDRADAAPPAATPATTPATTQPIPGVKPTGPETSAAVASPLNGIGGLTPIDQRRPSTPLDETQRRAKSLENLQRIADAIMAYKQAKGHYPSQALTAGAMKTLSWRVALLPYLGHEDLYKRFDPSKPWNKEPNASLLAYIPDCFVSPERFDTQTNWMVPAHDNFLFGENRFARDRRIEDGIENTIMLVEVDDAFAVPWTQPKDFEPTHWQDIRPELGWMRGDGAFAAWANGWPTLLSKNLSADQLRHAMTYEEGDGQSAGSIHREIEVSTAKLVVANSVAGTALGAADRTPSDPSSSQPDRTPPRQPVRSASAVDRSPVPSELQSLPAIARVDELYRDPVSQAQTPEDHRRLAQQMLRQADELIDDAPGRFALQSAAINQAIRAVDIEVLLQAIDHRIRTFEVDAYQSNLEALVALDKKVGKGDLDRQSEWLLRSRFVPVAMEAVVKDRYSDAHQLLGLVIRLSAKPGEQRSTIASRIGSVDQDEAIQKNLLRLKTSLSVTAKQYAEIGSHLAAFRSNPADADSGAAVGRFLCFIKGDWDMGLPLLTGGGSANLRRVAAFDLQSAADPAAHVAIADAWWELGQKAPAGIYRQGALDRAEYWYAMADASMSASLDKLHVQSRLAQTQSLTPHSPLATLRALGRQFGVDTTVSLQTLATSGSRAAPIGGDGLGDDYEKG